MTTTNHHHHDHHDHPTGRTGADDPPTHVTPNSMAMRIILADLSRLVLRVVTDFERCAEEGDPFLLLAITRYLVIQLDDLREEMGQFVVGIMQYELGGAQAVDDVMPTLVAKFAEYAANATAQADEAYAVTVERISRIPGVSPVLAQGAAALRDLPRAADGSVPEDAIARMIADLTGKG